MSIDNAAATLLSETDATGPAYGGRDLDSDAGLAQRAWIRKRASSANPAPAGEGVT
jgi:hypothetical protein